MTYNRKNAISYAHQWAFSRNPAFSNFNLYGGDCTNFISQCLHAGGAAMNYQRDTGWYYTSINNRAAAWTGVEFLYRFLTTNKSAGPAATELSINFAEPGDIIQLSFNGKIFGHSLLVVATKPEILIATHSDDSDNRPLFTYHYQIARLLHIEKA